MKRQTKTLCLVLMVTLVLSLAAVTAHAQMAQRPHMGAMPMLSQNPLSAEQQQRIANIRQQTDVQQIRADRSLSAQDRSNRIQEAQVAGHAEVMNVLTDAQKQEFQTWWNDKSSRMGRGPGKAQKGAMTGRGPANGDVPGLINNPLTAEQRSRISVIRERMQNQISAIHGDTSLSAAQKREQISEIQREGHQAVLNVFTPAQRQEFDAHWGARQRMR